jgi:excinuclease ABC subunit C
MSEVEPSKEQTAAQTTEPSRFDSKAFLSTLTSRPGIYKMLDQQADVLYVGKAKNLKNRVSSYFRASGLTNKTVALVSKIDQVEITVTHSETEALLLEHNLIKTLKPPYNILLRDDKSYPYIVLSKDKDYPRMGSYRGAHRKDRNLFGPYPSGGAVRESLNLLQKMFKIRSCEESFFKNRTRPCLQYQINRCSGPCVKLISPEDYQTDIRHASMFLQGKNQNIITELGEQMEAAANDLNYEKAAQIRDQISQLRQVQESQYVSGQSGNVDVVVIARQSGACCVQLLTIRDGQVLGGKSYFPKPKLEDSEEEIISAFLPQLYLNHTGRIPDQIVLNSAPEDLQCITDALTQVSGRPITITDRVRGHRQRWKALAITNAEQAITSFLANRQNVFQRLDALQTALDLDTIPQRIECFDISHTSGNQTVASCVVFGQAGAQKSDYRKFNIDGITPGDDYAAIAQAVKRRYTRLKKGEGKIPDILLIDGGKGQFSQAKKILTELQIEDILLVGVAKGAGRRPGLETLILDNNRQINLDANSPALHLIQQVRDEAHRFAITGHRARRGKAQTRSTLEDIQGVGAKRKRNLLNHFGGLQAIKTASAEEIAKTPGISNAMAEEIYNSLHNDADK